MTQRECLPNAQVLLKSMGVDCAERGTIHYEFMKRAVTSVLTLLPEKPLTAVAVSGELGMSIYQFRHRLLAASGIQPKQFVMRVRMEVACLLLKEHEDMEIFVVSMLCGYVDASNFTRAFKKYYGITPHNYRLKERGGK